MIPRTEMQSIALVLLFTFCQVIGTMCAMPDLSVAEETYTLVEEGVVCPMDGTIMCPPSITSSAESQRMHNLVADCDHATIALIPAAVLTAPSVPTQWSWSIASSIVPIAISSSSVLRI